MTVPSLKLNTDNSIPQMGFGMWHIKDRATCVRVVQEAVEAGFRHFDTAQFYGNEQHLAEGLHKTGLPREEVFITTKIWLSNFLRVNKSFETSLNKLQTDYVDLLLLHFPVTFLRKHAWMKLEKLHEQGKAKSIGVSNYTVRHLEQLLAYCKVKPAVNQVELHVFLQQPELLEYCRSQGIVVEAYSPLARGRAMTDATLMSIAKKHGKTVALVMLRWCIEVGAIPLPKSTHKDRMEQNLGVFSFKLDQEDMEKLSKLDRNMRTVWNPTRVP